jgi:DNA-binding ferritin-like protein
MLHPNRIGEKLCASRQAPSKSQRAAASSSMAAEIQAYGTVNYLLPLELGPVPVQLSRLLDALQIIIRQTRKLARRASELGDDGTNDLLVSEVLRTNELQAWFLSEHLVDVPLVKAKSVSAGMR